MTGYLVTLSHDPEIGTSAIRAMGFIAGLINAGKSIVVTAPREKAELDCHRLHHYGLWATMEEA